MDRMVSSTDRAPSTVTGSAVEAVARRDRLVVAAGLAVLTALGWTYLLVLAAQMGGMEAAMPAEMPTGSGGEMGQMAMPAFRPWSAADVALTFVMWAVMMVAMMTPGAAPMILLYAAVARKTRGGGVAAHTGAFAAGYLATWTAFSAIATLLQWLLGRAALLSPMMVSTSTALGGVLLVLAGVYQLTPLKRACLDHCRSPVHFLTGHWRPGGAGAFRMGLAHGAFCVGCCWVLMALLFVGGVMNLLWIAALAGFVLLEKVLPHGGLVGRAIGAMLIAAGVWMLAGTGTAGT